jgi:tetratricopeptide (TPR) repeat protein
LTIQALIKEQLEDLVDARESFRAAIEAWQPHPVHLRYEAVAGYGRCLYQTSGAREAAFELETYLLDLKRSGAEDPVAKARIFSTLIHIYRSLGLRDKELQAARTAQDLSPRVDDPDDVACLKLNVAAALIEHGEYEEAIQSAREAEGIYLSLGWPVATARSQIEGAIAYIARGELAAARDLLQDALKSVGPLGPHHPERGYVLNELGRVERLMGKSRQALEHLVEAARLLPEKDLSELALNARETGLALVKTDPKKAERELKRALSLYEEAQVPNEISKTLVHLSRLQRAHGNQESAFKTLERAVEASAGEVV